MTARLRISACLLVAVLLHGCATAVVTAPSRSDIIQGVASWYGEEFAGRVTASGEIFDPMQLTAAHPALPFGTVANVTNVQNGQMVEVRINDRGPFVGNRIIDLSYAAAEKIGLVEKGIGTVELKIVRLGDGKRVRDQAPPPPMDAGPPVVAFPLPHQIRAAQPPPDADEESEFTIEMVEERGGVPARRQVSSDGRDIESVPLPSEKPPLPVTETPEAPVIVAQPAPAIAAPPQPEPRFYLQLGAFTVESNAEKLRRTAHAIVPQVFIDDTNNLYRVRVGPYLSREAVIDAQERLTAAGLATLLLSE